MANDSGFSEAELTAMKERAAELRSQKGGNKKAKNLEALLEAIAALPEGDKQIAAAVHQIMTEAAPHLAPRLWYGMPAYADDADVVVFLQLSSKFDTRYSTLGFNGAAQLDDGEMWATHFAIPALTDVVRTRVAELVQKAVPPPS